MYQNIFSPRKYIEKRFFQLIYKMGIKNYRLELSRVLELINIFLSWRSSAWEAFIKIPDDNFQHLQKLHALVNDTISTKNVIRQYMISLIYDE